MLLKWSVVFYIFCDKHIYNKRNVKTFIEYISYDNYGVITFDNE